MQELDRTFLPHLDERIRSYFSLSVHLADVSDEALFSLAKEVPLLHTGRGGMSVMLRIAGRDLFVKKIPLTDIETQPQNWHSTANFFNLPLCYQYGVGSAGFGAWRELFAHTMTTHWVLEKACPSFPLLYHWRVLPSWPLESDKDDLAEELERVLVSGKSPLFLKIHLLSASGVKRLSSLQRDSTQKNWST